MLTDGQPGMDEYTALLQGFEKKLIWMFDEKIRQLSKGVDGSQSGQTQVPEVATTLAPETCASTPPGIFLLQYFISCFRSHAACRTMSIIQYRFYRLYTAWIDIVGLLLIEIVDCMFPVCCSFHAIREEGQDGEWKGIFAKVHDNRRKSAQATRK